ncbi:F-box domain-containing protein [Heracleum sosnowskyi]|uniref:F-box domain-containing protein n=2 Tax=Heracleum sosnowskyi TaxID=360622 RepID=A0AAD8MNV5_9APIA|nr:F-box domain-containing protein [Heracleum sosnowskyi]
MDKFALKKQNKRTMITYKSKIKRKAGGSGLQPLSSQLHRILSRKNHEARAKRHIKSIRQWNHLSPDLLGLVIDKLNYEERIRFRVVCKGWNIVKISTNNFCHDIPLNAIVEILMTLATINFQEFFNFYIYWIKGQTDTTIKALLNQIPIQRLYQWGNQIYRQQQRMFTYFMNMSQRLGNDDAEFYWVSRSIILRHHNYYDILECSYTIIKSISKRGHLISVLFKNMLDIYFFPEKRKGAVTALINMITNPGTKKTITGMIMALRSIAEEIYPETMFGPLSGTPICGYSHRIEDKKYKPDGYPVCPEQIDEYTCLECKVALLFGCLSAYLTSSFHLHLIY